MAVLKPLTSRIGRDPKHLNRKGKGRPIIRAAILTAAVLIAPVGSSHAQAAAQAPAAEADTTPVPIDSLRHWIDLGLHPGVLPNGDSVLVDAYWGLLAIGDSTYPRRWALYGTNWLLAQAWKRGFRHAAVVFVWPNPGDTLFEKPPAARWEMLFEQDALDCWHIVNDTTPISSCVARDDPNSPVRAQREKPAH